jgi:hypothetical protein
MCAHTGGLSRGHDGPAAGDCGGGGVFAHPPAQVSGALLRASTAASGMQSALLVAPQHPKRRIPYDAGFRGEKKVLNDINKRVAGDAPIKFPVPADPPAGGAGGSSARPGPPKPKDRICKATEKVFIMVRGGLRKQ